MSQSTFIPIPFPEIIRITIPFLSTDRITIPQFSSGSLPLSYCYFSRCTVQFWLGEAYTYCLLIWNVLLPYLALSSHSNLCLNITSSLTTPYKRWWKKKYIYTHTIYHPYIWIAVPIHNSSTKLIFHSIYGHLTLTCKCTHMYRCVCVSMSLME